MTTSEHEEALKALPDDEIPRIIRMRPKKDPIGNLDEEDLERRITDD